MHVITNSITWIVLGMEGQNVYGQIQKGVLTFRRLMSTIVDVPHR